MKKFSRWPVPVVAMAAVLGLLVGTTHAERRIVWCLPLAGGIPIGSGELRRANLDGAIPETFLATPCRSHVAIDPFFTRDIFYSDVLTVGNINRVSVDGGLPSGFVTYAGNSINGLALDLGVNGPLYFVGNSGGAGHIWRVNLDGSNITFILNTASPVHDLQLDPIGNRIYWKEADGIHRAIQTGTNPEFIVPEIDIRGIAVDGSNGFLYWTSTQFNDISRANLNGTGRISIVSGLPGLRGIRHDGLGRIYWIEVRLGGAPSNRIRRANANGTGVTTVVDLGTALSTAFDFLGMEVGFSSCAQTSPFGDANGSGFMNFDDISLIVRCFQRVNCSNADFNRSDLHPCTGADTCVGNGLVNFLDINAAVSAFRGNGCP